MKVKDRKQLDIVLSNHGWTNRHLWELVTTLIDRAVRKARREARSEATTCVDCRVVLLGDVPLCSGCRAKHSTTTGATT